MRATQHQRRHHVGADVGVLHGEVELAG